MDAVLKGARPLAKVHLVLIAHTHWDREWYLPLEEFRYRLVRLIDNIIETMEGDPSFAFFIMDGQAIVLEDYEQIRGRSERLRKLVREGRIKIGPWYILPDEFLVSAESIIRNLERGLRVAREWGVPPLQVGYLPDMFGHIGQMPQIFSQFGIRRALAWRGVPASAGNHEFNWIAKDGSSVLTKFLPAGYGYGANLPENETLLLMRLDELIENIGLDGGSPVFGLLCGSDHVEPNPTIHQFIAKAIKSRPGWSMEFADLERWFDLLEQKGPPRFSHQGEMRSADRSLILPSVASSRLYLKKNDFSVSSSLEMYAEPLSALSRALGGVDHRGFVDHAWKLLLENQPHDSICGCSVDPVHDEMMTRYHKAGQVARRVIDQSLGHVLHLKQADGLAVFSPVPGRGPVTVEGEIEARKRSQLAVALPNGEEPLQFIETVAPELTLWDVEMPRAAGEVALSEVLQPEVAGRYIAGIKLGRKGEALEVRVDVSSAPSGADLGRLKEEAHKALADKTITTIRINAGTLPRHRVAVRLPELPGPGLTVFPLVKTRARSQSAAAEMGPDLMENDLIRLQFEPGGTCLLTEKKSGMSYRALRFLDVGDRGDTYNFDPVMGEKTLCEAEKVTLKTIQQGPAAAVMEIRHRFRSPESLHSSRRSRSRKLAALDISTRVTMHPQSARVDFHTRFINNARDHRLQTAVRIPFELDSIRVESAFGLFDRPITNSCSPRDACAADLAATLLGREGTYSTSPQKSLAIAIKDGNGIALLNRGLSEIDAIKLEHATRVSMTLVRAVGWLSRGDLEMRTGNAGPPLPTPGAQCLMPFEWDWALLPFSGPDGESLAVREARAFAHPPVLVKARGGGEKEFTLLLARIDNPLVILSALREVGEEFEARLVNYSEKDEKISIEFNPLWRDPRITDLRGEPMEAAGIEVTANAVKGKIGGGKILTIRLKRA